MQKSTANLNLSWEPAAGYVIARPLKREEMNTGTTLVMADSTGKMSDSVGVGEVILCGTPDQEEVKLLLELEERGIKTDETKYYKLKPGDLIAWMPYTDKLLEQDLVKYSVVAYKQIMAIKKKDAK